MCQPHHSVLPIQTGASRGETESPGWVSAQLPPGEARHASCNPVGHGAHRGSGRHSWVRHHKSLLWRGGEGKGGEACHGCPVFVLGLWRICGIVPLRGVGLNLLVSLGENSHCRPGSSINLLVRFDPLRSYGELLLWAESHLFSESAEPSVWHRRAGQGWGSLPGLAKVVSEHPQHALALSLVLTLLVSRGLLPSRQKTKGRKALTQSLCCGLACCIREGVSRITLSLCHPTPLLRRRRLLRRGHPWQPWSLWGLRAGSLSPGPPFSALGPPLSVQGL